VEGLDLILEEEITDDQVRTLGREKSSALAAQVEESLGRLAAFKKALDDALTESASAS